MPKKIMFYVFYDKNDFVKYCGIARDLVARGYFSTVRNVKTVAHRMNMKRPNSVVKIPMLENEVRNDINVNL